MSTYCIMHIVITESNKITHELKACVLVWTATMVVENGLMNSVPKGRTMKVSVRVGQSQSGLQVRSKISRGKKYLFHFDPCPARHNRRRR